MGLTPIWTQRDQDVKPNREPQNIGGAGIGSKVTFSAIRT